MIRKLKSGGYRRILQKESEDRTPPQSRHLQVARRGGKARTRRAIFQAALKRVRQVRSSPRPVVPAKAGTQSNQPNMNTLDSRLRGNERWSVCGSTATRPKSRSLPTEHRRDPRVKIHINVSGSECAGDSPAAI